MRKRAPKAVNGFSIPLAIEVPSFKETSILIMITTTITIIKIVCNTAKDWFISFPALTFKSISAIKLLFISSYIGMSWLIAISCASAHFSLSVVAPIEMILEYEKEKQQKPNGKGRFNLC